MVEKEEYTPKEVAAEHLEQLKDTAIPAGKRLIDSYIGLEPIAVASEKTVYEYGDERVIAFFPRDDSEKYVDNLKNLYFQIKLAHILYPENVPNVHYMGSQPPMIIYDKVRPKKLEGKGVWPPHGEVKDLDDRFLGTGLVTDLIGIDNFIRDVDGHIKYVDSFRIRDFEKLKSAIEKLPDDKKRKALKYLDRLDRTRGNEWFVASNATLNERLKKLKKIKKTEKRIIEI